MSRLSPPSTAEEHYTRNDIASIQPSRNSQFCHDVYGCVARVSTEPHSDPGADPRRRPGATLANATGPRLPSGGPQLPIIGSGAVTHTLHQVVGENAVRVPVPVPVEHTPSIHTTGGAPASTEFENHGAWIMEAFQYATAYDQVSPPILRPPATVSAPQLEYARYGQFGPGHTQSCGIRTPASCWADAPNPASRFSASRQPRANQAERPTRFQPVRSLERREQQPVPSQMQGFLESECEPCSAPAEGSLVQPPSAGGSRQAGASAGQVTSGAFGALSPNNPQHGRRQSPAVPNPLDFEGGVTCQFSLLPAHGQQLEMSGHGQPTEARWPAGVQRLSAPSAAPQSIGGSEPLDCEDGLHAFFHDRDPPLRSRARHASDTGAGLGTSGGWASDAGLPPGRTRPHGALGFSRRLTAPAAGEPPFFDLSGRLSAQTSPSCTPGAPPGLGLATDPSSFHSGQSEPSLVHSADGGGGGATRGTIDSSGLSFSAASGASGFSDDAGTSGMTEFMAPSSSTGNSTRDAEGADALGGLTRVGSKRGATEDEEADKRLRQRIKKREASRRRYHQQQSRLMNLERLVEESSRRNAEMQSRLAALLEEQNALTRRETELVATQKNTLDELEELKRQQHDT